LTESVDIALIAAVKGNLDGSVLYESEDNFSVCFSVSIV
jgi:hypothetical protein